MKVLKTSVYTYYPYKIYSILKNLMSLKWYQNCASIFQSEKLVDCIGSLMNSIPSLFHASSRPYKLCGHRGNDLTLRWCDHIRGWAKFSR